MRFGFAALGFNSVHGPPDTDKPHAHIFADPVIHIDDLLNDREQLRGAVAAIV
jgi:hypothetical protein